MVCLLACKSFVAKWACMSIFVLVAVLVKVDAMHNIDTETEGSTVFMNPRYL